MIILALFRLFILFRSCFSLASPSSQLILLRPVTIREWRTENFKYSLSSGRLMVEDLSRNTVFVLVILTLLISILGTWTVLSQVNAGPAAASAPSPGGGSGHVSLTIGKPQPVVGDVTGHVVLAINHQ